MCHISRVRHAPLNSIRAHTFATGYLRQKDGVDGTKWHEWRRWHPTPHVLVVSRTKQGIPASLRSASPSFGAVARTPSATHRRARAYSALASISVNRLREHRMASTSVQCRHGSWDAGQSSTSSYCAMGGRGCVDTAPKLWEAERSDTTMRVQGGGTPP